MHALTASFLHTGGVEEDAAQCAASRKGLDSDAPPPSIVHGSQKATVFAVPTAVGSAE